MYSGTKIEMYNEGTFTEQPFTESFCFSQDVI